MVALVGFLGSSLDGGVNNPNISTMLSEYAVDYWPPHASAAAADLSGIAARHLPVQPSNVRAVSGFKAAHFTEDWYDRIHVKPRLLDLGNVISSQLRYVEVWNAYRGQSKTLTGVAASNASGIVVTAPAVYPITFKPLQAMTWSVNVTLAGSPSINATLAWQFTGEADLALSITGQRVTGWSLPPDWARGVTETLYWLTDVQEAIDGSIDRMPLREVPRREWEFETMVTGGQGSTRHYRELMETLLASWRARVWALPVWTDQTVLTTQLAAGSPSIALDTSGLDFEVGSYAMLYAALNDYEILEVANVTANAVTFALPTSGTFAAGARIWPCRLARLTDAPKLNRSNANLVRTTLRFRAYVDNTWPATAPATTYAGYPVLEDRPDESGGLASHVDHQLVQLDGDVGGIYLNDPTGLPWLSQGYQWRLHGRAERAAHRSLLYWLAGRAEALWLPSFADDLTLTQDAAGGVSVINVVAGGFTQFAAGLAGKRHIRIELNDGTLLYRGITNWSEVDADTEQAVLDAPLASGLARTDVRQISFMALVQGSRDEVEIDHQNTIEGIARCSLDFSGLPAEEPTP